MTTTATCAVCFGQRELRIRPDHAWCCSNDCYRALYAAMETARLLGCAAP